MSTLRLDYLASTAYYVYIGMCTELYGILRSPYVVLCTPEHEVEQ